MPKIKLINAVNTNISMMLPPEINSTNSVITKPIPVKVTVPTTIPAAAVATPIPIILREPVIMPSNSSIKPVLTAPDTDLFCLKYACNGRCVTTMKIINIVAQNADRPGEKRSTVKHHTSTTIGKRKYKPAFAVGPGSGNISNGLSGSSITSSGKLVEYFTKPI